MTLLGHLNFDNNNNDEYQLVFASQKNKKFYCIYANLTVNGDKLIKITLHLKNYKKSNFGFKDIVLTSNDFHFDTNGTLRIAVKLKTGGHSDAEINLEKEGINKGNLKSLFFTRKIKDINVLTTLNGRTPFDLSQEDDVDPEDKTKSIKFARRAAGANCRRSFVKVQHP